MKERWDEFIEDCKDTVKEIAPVLGLIALLVAGAFFLAFIADKSKEEKEKPSPEPAATVAAVAVATPEPTPFPTMSPEEIAEKEEEEALWKEEALEFAKENLPQNYTELVYEYYELLEYCLMLEEDVQDLEDDLEYERGY